MHLSSYETKNERTQYAIHVSVKKGGKGKGTGTHTLTHSSWLKGGRGRGVGVRGAGGV